MPSFEYDLRYLEAGVDQLENYLLSKDLYWPLGVAAPSGETPYPQLTIGGLLLAHERLSAAAQTPAQQADLAEIDRRLTDIRSRWRVAWEKKAGQDFRARLNLWRDFLEDYREQPSSNHDRYAYEIGRRVQLQLLHSEVEVVSSAETQMLNGLDSLLRSVFSPGPFIWEDYLTATFPSTVYWYLYGRVRKDSR